MSKHPPETDANQNAARIVGEATARHEKPLPADAEAAWSAWIAGVGNVDARAMALLRAAFEVGIAAATVEDLSKNPAAVLGRLGGLTGGKARAASLSPKRRKEIAKKAADKRWGK